MHLLLCVVDYRVRTTAWSGLQARIEASEAFVQERGGGGGGGGGERRILWWRRQAEAKEEVDAEVEERGGDGGRGGGGEAEAEGEVEVI